MDRYRIYVHIWTIQHGLSEGFMKSHYECFVEQLQWPRRTAHRKRITVARRGANARFDTQTLLRICIVYPPPRGCMINPSRWAHGGFTKHPQNARACFDHIVEGLERLHGQVAKSSISGTTASLRLIGNLMSSRVLQIHSRGLRRPITKASRGTISCF